MLTVVTWRWGNKYGPEYVERLRAGVARNLSMEHRFLCIGDELPIQDPDLLQHRDGCYARLRMFDPEWLESHGIDRLVCMDLDIVVTGALDPLFNRSDPFMILHGGHWNPCPFNGSLMMIERGARTEIWSEFSLESAEKVATADGVWRGTDQTWIAHIAGDAPGWTYRDGVYSFRKPGWPDGDDLPGDARIVSFPGKRDPSNLTHVDWIRRHWSA